MSEEMWVRYSAHRAPDGSWEVVKGVSGPQNGSMSVVRRGMTEGDAKQYAANANVASRDEKSDDDDFVC